ncbi:MAG TPA: hypothetical protein VJV03_07485, partial [Pyrinomonadaceae bacterium]|nr:hypothetical protein [Pyrinomonadaceae bacterium]
MMLRAVTNIFARGLVAMSLCFLLFGETYARVGGGQGYGGGGSGGDGDGGGAIIWLIFELIRLLVYLTIEYPVIGIPLDIIVIAALIWFFVFRRSTSPKTFITGTSGLTPGTASFQTQHKPAKAFERLRQFDPNFSEIVFTDFCYTLYARAHHARGVGSNALDQLSPYLSERARKALLQLNSAGQPEVQGIIIG